MAGAVMGDISTRRGRIVGTDSNDEGETIIVVRVPYAEVLCIRRMASPFRGSGTYSVRLNGYEPAPLRCPEETLSNYMKHPGSSQSCFLKAKFPYFRLHLLN